MRFLNLYCLYIITKAKPNVMKNQHFYRLLYIILNFEIIQSVLIIIMISVKEGSFYYPLKRIRNEPTAF